MKITLPLDDSQRALVRPVSKAVFSSLYALEAMASMARGERFYQGQVAKDAGCEASYLSEFMKRLAVVGLIEPLPHDPGQARKYYRPLAGPLWESVIDLLEHLLSEDGSGVARLSDRR